ncbi:hypothetical protein Q757_06645 [Oenococcus alcoholitolerans]|uniref:Uncharacterized protein n=1 Tax=Oenococcus alcoholitolerans TaxID=931074 RepID=A0ABR4XPZ9_9LACO|nr:hypothetical protein Q757_06645 [Oenococcus alcoholitolerans]
MIYLKRIQLRILFILIFKNMLFIEKEAGSG